MFICRLNCFIFWSALLKYNLHIIKPVNFKCLIQWILTNISSHVITTAVITQTIFITPGSSAAPLRGDPAPSVAPGHRGSVFFHYGCAWSISYWAGYRNILVSCGYSSFQLVSKWPQTWWLKTTKIYSLKFQRPDLKSRFRQDCFLLEAQRESLFTPRAQLLVAASNPWRSSVRSRAPPFSASIFTGLVSVCICLRVPFSLLGSQVPSSHEDTRRGLRATLIQYELILTLIISAKTLFPKIRPSWLI